MSREFHILSLQLLESRYYIPQFFFRWNLIYLRPPRTEVGQLWPVDQISSLSASVNKVSLGHDRVLGYAWFVALLCHKGRVDRFRLAKPQRFPLCPFTKKFGWPLTACKWWNQNWNDIHVYKSLNPGLCRNMFSRWKEKRWQHMEKNLQTCFVCAFN